MLLRGALCLLLALTSASAVPAATRTAAPPPCRPLAFEGEVRRAQGFQHPFGAGLLFTLEPVPNGWAVRVWPATGPRPAVDLATLATPPFRSVSPLLLTTDFGFRAQDVVGWSPRTFHYLPGRAALPAAERAFAAVTSSLRATLAQEDAVLAAIRPALEGQLAVLDASFTPGTADASPAAAATATHLASIPHTTVSGPPSPLGTLAAIRFRVSLQVRSAQTSAPCRQ